MPSRQRVLVVDGLSETGEVLKAILEPRGLVVDRIRGHRESDHAAARPHVVIVDGDECSESRAQHSGWADVPQVVIGSADMPDHWHPHRPFVPTRRYLQKPFEYGELVSAVEHLLRAA
ncbi:MAG TPA: hypothetical protein VML55_23775 [Planctomycetaceae bacterium]|nr:hypothetical protein [Planctomycetaceae bacterium]